MCKIIYFSLVIVFVLLFVPRASKAQDRVTIQTPSRETMKKIYDLAFPRLGPTFDPKIHEFIIDVLIDPSFHAPSQVSIVKYRDGRLIARRLDLRNRDEGLGDQVMSLIESHDRESDVKTLKLTETEVVKALNVIETKVRITRPFKEAVRRFFSCHTFKKETRYWLDGADYEIWYVDGGSELYFEHVESERPRASAPSLVIWAVTIMNTSQ